jgi:arogenate/prephenate dehydratase
MVVFDKSVVDVLFQVVLFIFCRFLNKSLHITEVPLLFLLLFLFSSSPWFPFLCKADWQSSCAILASKVVSQEQPMEKPGAVGGSGAAGGAEHVVAVNGHKPHQSAQKALTITDLSPAPMHGLELRVAYQGVPDAYSKATAGKAYPNCEAIPCDQFKVAFQAVELWITDRAVLPVENSLGDSIHRNYDLLLRHHLHIISEVQLPVQHCLLVFPGVRKEYLTLVISHSRALAQCKLTLTNGFS